MTSRKIPCRLATVPHPIQLRTALVLAVTSILLTALTLSVLLGIVAMVAQTTKSVILQYMCTFAVLCTVMLPPSCVQVVNYEHFKNFTVVATSGPTHQELPPFKWSNTEWARPKGHPDEFNFQPVVINFNT